MGKNTQLLEYVQCGRLGQLVSVHERNALYCASAQRQIARLVKQGRDTRITPVKSHATEHKEGWETVRSRCPRDLENSGGVFLCAIPVALIESCPRLVSAQTMPRCVVGHLRVTIQYELQALSHAYHSADWEPPAPLSPDELQERLLVVQRIIDSFELLTTS